MQRLLLRRPRKIQAATWRLPTEEQQGRAGETEDLHTVTSDRSNESPHPLTTCSLSHRQCLHDELRQFWQRRVLVPVVTSSPSLPSLQCESPVSPERLVYTITTVNIMFTIIYLHSPWLISSCIIHFKRNGLPTFALHEKRNSLNDDMAK